MGYRSKRTLGNLARMENPRKEYIRLLLRSVENFTPEPGELRDATLIGELGEAGYLKAKTIGDEYGVTRGAASWGMTVAGRLFLNQLQREERESSAWGRFKKWGVPLLTYLAGVATPVLSDFLKALFHLKP